METIVVVVKDGAVKWVFADQAYRVVVLDDDEVGMLFGDVVEVNDHRYTASALDGNAAPDIVAETLEQVDGVLHWMH